MTPHYVGKHIETVKAGALLCPVCCVEYINLEVDFEVEGKVFRNVKVLKCPVCQEEQFTPEQQEAFEKQIRNHQDP
jgi:hypothetical protein